VAWLAVTTTEGPATVPGKPARSSLSLASTLLAFGSLSRHLPLGHWGSLRRSAEKPVALSEPDAGFEGLGPPVIERVGQPASGESGKERFELGPQRQLGTTWLYVVPNPSPANAHFTLRDQSNWYDRLAGFLGDLAMAES
jgi:hypothetical protein